MGENNEYPEPKVKGFSKFRDIVDNRHDYARKWKEENVRPVIGYYCTYTPVEILYAAGALPVRVFGGHRTKEVSSSDPYIFRGMWCPFSRDVLSQGLLGKYDYLDGIAMASSCYHMRQAFWSWEREVLGEDQFFHYLVMPHGSQQPGSEEYYLEELKDFKKSVEDHFGVEITDEDLREAIDVYNKNRRLMKKVYEYRKADEPRVSGLNAKEMVQASQISDPADHNEILEQVLNDLEGELEGRKTKHRLMMIGSENDDREFMHMVEEELPFDITVVVEEECVGTRAFWDEVDEDGDPLMNIAERYVRRIPCPNKDWPHRRRLDRIKELVEEYNVDGVLLFQQKFCDPHELDIPRIQEYLEDELNIPKYFLEFEVSVPAGQFRTRVEAFAEQLEMETEEMADLY